MVPFFEIDDDEEAALGVRIIEMFSNWWNKDYGEVDSFLSSLSFFSDHQN